MLCVVTALAGCGGAAVLPDGTTTIGGEVHFENHRGGVPADVVEIVLVDTADPDSRVGPLGRERVSDPGDDPVPFTLVYSIRSVQSGHTYGLCARALDASGDVTWHSESPLPVKPPTDETARVLVTRDRGDWVPCRWQ